MCGILLHVGPQCSQVAPWWESMAETNAARGPDGVCTEQVALGDCQVRMQGSVLALRGASVTHQPIVSSNRQLLLLWNGEVFDSQSGMDPLANDGKQIMETIEEQVRHGGAKEDALCRVLGSVEGPYAMLLLDSDTCTVYYGRDPLGRRSLLRGAFAADTQLLLCSAASEEAIQSNVLFSEVDCSSLWKQRIGSDPTGVEALPRNTTPFTTPLQLRELQEGGEDRAKGDIDRVDVMLRFLSILSESVQRRVQHIRPQQGTTQGQVAILFSGGLDCCTLALLAHHHIDESLPIDLLNVAFENPRVLQSKTGSSTSTTYDVPDRQTGRLSCQELQTLAPNRQWNLVEVNVSHKDYLAERGRVESLMAPSGSVMDLSIASALYFACRGRGCEGYTSSARVLLSGLGADELLGGYSRHRKAWQMGGKKALVRELQTDLDRLPTRNLGRDDRILSSSGKEARYPFLSHSVLSFLAALPVEAKMDFELLPPGQGDKRLLRQVAHHLGLHQTSTLVKRAIQFGARSAKIEVGGGKVKGHERLRV